MTEPYRWGGIEYKSLVVPVSAEMAAAVAAAPSFADLMAAARNRPRLTPEQEQAIIDGRNAEAFSRHGAVLHQHHGTLRAVVAHHAPLPIESPSLGPYCGGCDDSAGYSDESPAWPCSTFLMIEADLPAVEAS